MIRSLSKLTVNPYLLEKSHYLLPQATSIVHKRTTVIVKRINKPPLQTGSWVTQKHLDESVVDADDYKYTVYKVEETKQEEHEVKLILKRTVDDYGKKGQIVNVPYRKAHKHLLLPGFAVYHSDENLEKYRDIIIPEDVEHHSTETARLMINFWSKRVLDVVMNMDVPWTIEKWHIKASLRKHRLWVSEDRIEIPGGQICGPDMELQNKEFIAILTVSPLEKLKIRCRLHHYTDDPDRSLNKGHWYHNMAEPVWEAERQELLDMNKAPPSEKQKIMKELQPDLEKFTQWKQEREGRLAEQ